MAVVLTAQLLKTAIDRHNVPAMHVTTRFIVMQTFKNIKLLFVKIIALDKAFMAQVKPETPLSAYGVSFEEEFDTAPVPKRVHDLIDLYGKVRELLHCNL